MTQITKTLDYDYNAFTRCLVRCQSNSANALATPLPIFEAITGQDVFITDIYISANVAMTVTIKDELGNIVFNKIYLVAKGNATLNLSTPICLDGGKSLSLSSSITGEVSVYVGGFYIPHA